MDPVTGAVVAGVLWFFVGGAGGGLIFWLVAVIWAAVFGQKLLGLGVALGWLLAFAWEIFVIVQVTLQIVNFAKAVN